MVKFQIRLSYAVLFSLLSLYEVTGNDTHKRLALCKCDDVPGSNIVGKICVMRETRYLMRDHIIRVISNLVN